ncbi:MAG: transcription antitermination factor NusB [Proteobacteria bacterium]|jgi:N utilization substance protein B|nr:transcription antitermination factor NusB [Pseudomonadota bacterium]
MSEARARRRARELALQGLYQRQLARHADREIASDLATSPGWAAADQVYFGELWRGVTSEYDALLGLVATKLDRKPAELAPVERALLVIGAWELTHRADIPWRAVIDEAIELAKAYGGTDGHRFVNAVLDKLVPELRASELTVAEGRR